MRRLFILAAPLAVIAGLTTACGGGDDSSGDAAEAGTTTAALPATPSGSGASPEDALAPGADVVSENGYSYKLVSVTPDASEAILAENEFNEQPADGEQFVMIRIEATRTADADALFGPESALRLSGPGDVTYTTFDNSCGVLPEQWAETPELTVDESREGNICFAVPAEDVDALVMYEEAASGDPVSYRRLG